jgi:hypothetical protein
VKSLRRLAQVLAGLLCGLVLLEVAFHLRDHGAFPHLNCYRPDAQLGVRLQPGATEKISFSKNPRSQVRINAQGYRGADWPARAEGEILVVGDSQAFVLGVDEDDAFAWRIGKLLGRPVANGAVPTYGPEEYNAVLAEELPRRKPRTVVYTINIANDLFEAAHPNRQRHAVWDGWAVRKETAPAKVTSFPGRAWLFAHSHAFFAARGLWFRRSGAADEASTPSEGGWRDLVAAGESLTAEQARTKQAADDERKRRDDALAAAQKEVRQLDVVLGEKMNAALPDEEVGAPTLHAARAQPGDIVRVYLGEGSRPVPVIATEIQRAAEVRRRFEKKLREAHDEQTLAALKRHDALDDQVANLRVAAIGAAVRARSPLRAHLERAKKLCDDNGAELVVLVLPLDVMVSPEEWKKYQGARPLDLSATRVLADDVVTMAEELGARAVDAWPALAKAEPGAFLWGDLHMTPKGHAAVAAAIKDELSHPRVPRPRLDPLPLGRSPVPSPAEWADPSIARSVQAPDASDLKRYDCRAQQVREWLRVVCRGGDMQVVRTGRAEPMILNTDDGATLVAALLEGSRFSVFRGGKRSGLLSINWAIGEPTYEGSFYDANMRQPLALLSTEARALCECHKQLTGTSDCVGVYGSVEPGCFAAYAGQCRPLLACARGEATSPPLCGSDERPKGVANRCRVDDSLADLIEPR